MGERIYARSQDGRLEPLEEQVFATEDDLQALIADHLELLDGKQIQPDNPRRWILVTREKGIAESPGASRRWAVDHLIVDQDAVLTLVEVKRASNPEIRRTIVGQMLEYAAHATATWTKEELRRSFEESSRDQGRDPDQVLGELLGPDEAADADRFWDEVARNLAAHRIRLLFVADDIPEPLERVVAFLNTQMPGIQVLAVQVKQFRGEQIQTLVPRVLGRTASSPAAGSAPRLTREKFLGDFSIEIQQKTAAQLLDVARDAGATFEWGSSGVSVRVPCPLRTQPVTVAWLYPPSTSEKGWMKTRAFTFGTAILESDPDERLRAILQRWVGQFEGDPFADASSNGVQARSIDHAEAVGQVDRLTALCTDVISEIRSLGARC